MTTDTSSRPLRADAARNRARVLQAAREVFAERGVDVTLDEIAQHAGLGTGTVYRRFANREALIEELFEERVARTAELAERSLLDPDPWQGLVTVLRATCAELAADRGLRQVLMCSAYGRDRVACAREQVKPLMIQLVDRATAAGVVRAGVQASDVLMIFLVVSTVADFAGHVAPDAWQRYFTIMLDGLRPGAAIAALPVSPLDPAQMAQAMSSWRPSSRR